MSKIAEQLKANLAKNLENHTKNEKKFDGFDFYQNNRLEIVSISDILPNPAQPRTEFDPELLQELADSIDKNGLLQPVTVRKNSHGYVLVAGERRLRACQLLGKTSIECLIVNIDDQQNALLALSENLSRQDLADFEVAKAVANIQKSFNSKTELAKSLGISRAKLYKLLSFEELPLGFKEQLEKLPNLISADTAEQIRSIKGELDVDTVTFDEWLIEFGYLLQIGKLKQSHFKTWLFDKIKKDEPVVKVQQGAEKKMIAPAATNVKRMYVKDGKNVGRVKADGKRLVIELNQQDLNSEQELKLMTFLDDLFH